MPFTDVINDYSNGATGTLTDINGATVDYSIASTSPTVDWNDLTDGARVNANGSQQFTVTFDDPVVGAAMQISGSDSTEIYYIVVDGVAVDLNILIANGDVIFTQSGAATHQIGSDGSISGGQYTDGSIAELVFTIPVTSLGAYGTNGGSGNWDYFEVGIDSTIFNIVCFASGTLISTNVGPRRIEDLAPNDQVMTANGSYQPIRWIGKRTIGKGLLTKHPKLCPVRITAGALGNGLPEHDLCVSRQHRILVSSSVAKRMFGHTDVLIAANKLTALNGIYTDETIESIDYHHILLDQHDVIFAEGTPSESLYTGAEGLRSLQPTARQEILTIFPELAETDHIAKPARYIPIGRRQKRLVSRHLSNDKPMLELFNA
ncbi:MAG: Hint domain-containing protein [Pseudoruegeria sp.]